MSQIFVFTVISQMFLECEPGAARSALKESKLRLEVSKNLNKGLYLDNRDLPKTEAIKPITAALIQGLMTNIKHADSKGWWKESDHFKYVIDELQRMFTDVGYSNPELEEGWM
jgi:hypothetical protein